MSGNSNTIYTSQPITATFDSAAFMVGAGVAIFHLATGRVVLCSYEAHGRKVDFLPKGRRDAGEESGVGAEREGYEEVGSDVGDSVSLFLFLSYSADSRQGNE